MSSIKSLLPDHEALLSFEPEELAGYLLEHLNALPDQEQQLNRYSFSLNCAEDYPNEPRDLRERISRALMEAWVWLEREGFLAPRPGQRGEWAFITRRGQRIIGHAGLETHQKSNLLPKKLLHPILATKVWPTFIRGDYDTAVFQAFKEVEVLVRQKGGFKNEDLGASLMRKAFHKDNGPLTDMSVPEAERESKGHLFAGAIGLYKNPSSHRHAIDSPEETVEMILLASHLLRILDRWSQP